MKRAILVMALVIVGLSCLVDRRSQQFECDDDTDCNIDDTNRECSNGFCIETICPSICDDCDPGKVCKIVCDNPSPNPSNKCRNGVSCPVGFTCEIDCSQNCSPVTCLQGGCTVTCSGTATCGPITCGVPGTCSCTGTGCQ